MKHVLVDGNAVYPSKIICIGRNYVEHIAELNNQIPDQMVVFYKPNSAISDTLYSFHEEPLSYEGELCLMYRNGKFDAVAFGLDLTKRTLQSALKAKQLPWERCKAFKNSALFSPFVSIESIQTAYFRFELTINHELTQQGDPSLMMFTPDAILKDLQSFIDLEDGDIVMTGTPKGVGLVPQGAVFQGVVFSGNDPITKMDWAAQ